MLLLVLGIGSACKGAGGGGHASVPGRLDTAFAATQARGRRVMGVDQYTSAHVFEDLPDGGRIILDRVSGSDTTGITTIRQHMRDVAAAFAAGVFAKPFQVVAALGSCTAVMTHPRAALHSMVRVHPPRAGRQICSTYGDDISY